MSKQGNFLTKRLPNLLDVGQRTNLRIPSDSRIHFTLHHQRKEYQFFVLVTVYNDTATKLNMATTSRPDLLNYLADNGFIFRLVGFNRRPVYYIHIGKLP